MLCQRRIQVVLALCLLLVLWQCFRAPMDGLGPFPWAPSLLDAPAAHCTAGANSSAWFNARYNMAMGPLLTGAAHELSSDVVQWWLVSGGTGKSSGVFSGSQNLFVVGQGQDQVRQMRWGMKGMQGPQLTIPVPLWAVLHPFPKIPSCFSVPFPGLCWEKWGSVPL